MKKRVFLPTKHDWLFWFDLYKKIGIDLSQDSAVIDYDQSIIILKLSKQILDGFPTGIEELINDRSGFAWIVDHNRPIGSPSQEISRTIINKIRDLSRREPFNNPNLVISSSFKKWELKYNVFYEPKNIFKQKLKSSANKRTKSELGYRLTGAGVIASELILSVPCLMDEDNIFNQNNFFTNYEILKNKNRYKWRRSFLEENNFVCNQFHLDTFQELKEILKDNEELFWNMSSSQTLLFRQIHSLEQLIRQDALTQSYLNDLDDFNNASPFFASAFETRIKYAKNILDNFLYPELKEIGISLDEYNSSSPPYSTIDSRSILVRALPDGNSKNLFLGKLLEKSIFLQPEHKSAFSCAVAALHVFGRIKINDRSDFEYQIDNLFKISKKLSKNNLELSFEDILDILKFNEVDTFHQADFNDFSRSMHSLFLMKIAWGYSPDISNKRPHRKADGDVEDELFILINFLDRERVICWEPSFSGLGYTPLFESTRKELISANSRLVSKQYINKLICIRKP